MKVVKVLWVDSCNSNMNWTVAEDIEHTEPNHLNYYWDFEPIKTATDEHWQNVRERAAIAAMQGALANCYLHSVSNYIPYSSIAKESVLYADALIKELRKEK